MLIEMTAKQIKKINALYRVEVECLCGEKIKQNSPRVIYTQFNCDLAEPVRRGKIQIEAVCEPCNFIVAKIFAHCRGKKKREKRQKLPGNG